MIVDTVTGEILDLSPLARKPKGPPTHRLDHQRTYKDKQLIETLAIVIILALIVIVTLILKQEAR